MLFQSGMSKILAARGYRHNPGDEEFTRHGTCARFIQYAFSKEWSGIDDKIIDIISLGVDLKNEKFIVGFFRENISIEKGILENSEASIPLTKFSLGEFEKLIDRIIPPGSPHLKMGATNVIF